MTRKFETLRKAAKKQKRNDSEEPIHTINANLRPVRNYLINMTQAIGAPAAIERRFQFAVSRAFGTKSSSRMSACSLSDLFGITRLFGCPRYMCEKLSKLRHTDINT